METFKSFEEGLLRINEQTFDSIALQLYHFQQENNPVYRSFVTQSGHGRATVIEQIPFLPISFFKNHEVKTGIWHPQTVFTSSGTSNTTISRHEVKELGFYLQHAETVFGKFFGSLDNYHLLALLPSYLEREGSSLVAMVDHFIRRTNSSHSDFYLGDHEKLVRVLEQLRSSSKKVILLGVSFALLDLAERYALDLSNCLVMETGGMKGRRKEMVREELHRFLCSRWNLSAVLSEYGMTELLSQAYSLGHGRFQAPPSMKVLIRDVNDPFAIEPVGKTGGINVIDLANIHSCAFIETEDLGHLNQDGSFEVLGRLDNSDIRGCNLMAG